MDIDNCYLVAICPPLLVSDRFCIGYCSWLHSWKMDHANVEPGLSSCVETRNLVLGCKGRDRHNGLRHHCAGCADFHRTILFKTVLQQFGRTPILRIRFYWRDELRALLMGAAIAPLKRLKLHANYTILPQFSIQLIFIVVYRRQKTLIAGAACSRDYREIVLPPTCFYPNTS